MPVRGTRGKTSGEEPRFGSRRPHRTPKLSGTARTSVELFEHGSLNLSPKRQYGALLGPQVECGVRTSAECLKAVGMPGLTRASVRGGSLSLQPALSCSQSPILWLCTQMQYVLTFQQRKRDKDPLTVSNKSTSDSSELKATHGRKGKVRLWVMVMVCPRMPYTNKLKVTLYV